MAREVALTSPEARPGFRPRESQVHRGPWYGDSRIARGGTCKDYTLLPALQSSFKNDGRHFITTAHSELSLRERDERPESKARRYALPRRATERATV